MLTPQRTGRRQVTVARALSKLGVATRSEARRLVESGTVSVNGKPVLDPGLWLDPREDRLAVGGKRVRPAPRLYLVMHKPAGVVTTRSDERGRRTVYDLLPAGLPRMFPIGRLDKETSGLLLFTNDTRFGEAVTNPLAGTPKTYRVVIDRPLRAPDRRLMQKGMTLADGTTLRPASVDEEDPVSCRVTIHEGKNRQIRRMFEELGYGVVSLHRQSIGPITLGALRPGEVRALTSDEAALLTREALP
ncbi:MAG TPA: pseudouridine synthase [Bacteroidota bacterium]